MSDPRAATLEGPTDQFPSQDFPVIFTDGPWSLVNSSHVVKMYFARLDPSFSGDGKNRASPAMQLVMPIDSFVRMFAFIEAQLRPLQGMGLVTDNDIAQARAIYSQEVTR